MAIRITHPTLILLAAAIVACIARIDSARGQSAGFKFKDINDKSLGLWEGERPVFVYNHGQQSLPGVRGAQPRSSYLHPIYGLDGEVLTDDFPADHYHHHGLFWGWPHVTVGGREYDLWINRGIRIDFEKIIEKATDDDGASLIVQNGWYVGETRIMDERATFRTGAATADGRPIDVVLVWTPTDRPITLRGAEEKSYGGLTLRFAPRTKTAITTPAGRADEDLLMKELAWADLSAQFEGALGRSGAAIFVHPSHPDYPPEWMTRDYGVLAVGWPGVEPTTLEPGKPVTCHYRVWIHRGMPEVEAIKQAYDEYRKVE